MNYFTIGKYVGGALLGLGLAWAIYAGIIRPTTKPQTTTSQKAESITNNTLTVNIKPPCGLLFGINNVKINYPMNKAE